MGVGVGLAYERDESSQWRCEVLPGNGPGHGGSGHLILGVRLSRLRIREERCARNGGCQRPTIRVHTLQNIVGHLGSWRSR